MKVAEKINDEYCVEGSAWQVNFKGDSAALIEQSVNKCKSGEAKDVEEDLFDSAQDEVYQLMLLDLYPAFVDHIAILGGGRASEEEKGPDTLMDILGGINPAGMRSFERYVRAHFCEEALLFWLEANDFQIRFDKTDLESRAKEIYKDYMGETAKARINTSDECIAKVWEKIEKKAVTNMLFFDAQKEVEQFLDLDIFPRYQEWIAEGGDNEAAATGGDISSLQDESRLGDREKMREAVAQLLLIEVEAKKLRTIAHALDAEENINFYFEILEYKKLFQEQDRKEKAATIWKTFLDAKADRPVTIPDDKHKKIMKVRLSGRASDAPRAAHPHDPPPPRLLVLVTPLLPRAPLLQICTDKGKPKPASEIAATDTLFNQALKETLHLITDNIYPVYLKKEAEGKGGSPAPAPAPAPKGGGCCAVL